jgi:ABC-2 type transport system ATP-binding protein
MNPVIETEGLSRSFGVVRAVEAVDLRVERASVYAFLGANGAGKTTTIRMLLGLIRPDAGTVRMFGEPFRRGLLARVGALVETPSLYPHLTGRENLEVTRRLTGRTRAQVERALATVRLTDAAGRAVAGYSLGMRQRLGLALALLGDPDLLVLDEPTNGLDPAGIREIRELVSRLAAERGLTVFISSHLLAEVEQMATHVGIIERGSLLFQGTLKSLQARMQPRLEIGADRPAEAVSILSAASYRAGQSNGTHVVVEGADAASAARANSLLVGSGIAVHHLQLRAPSLEEVFLSMTEQVKSSHAEAVESRGERRENHVFSAQPLRPLRLRGED